MTRRPSMPFYAGDWLGGTSLLTTAAKGAYIDMLATAWETGPIPNTPVALYRAMRLGPDDNFEALWSELRPKWTLTAEGWINAKVEQVREKYDTFIARQSANGKRGGRPKKNPTVNPGETQNKPTGSENRNPDETQTETQAKASDLRSPFPISVPKTQIKGVCSTPSDDVVSPTATPDFPLKNGRLWSPSDSLLRELRRTFPLVDFAHELPKARLYLETRPSRRKTEGGMPKFLANWLTTAESDRRKAQPAQVFDAAAGQRTADEFRQLKAMM